MDYLKKTISSISLFALIAIPFPSFHMYTNNAGDWFPSIKGGVVNQCTARFTTAGLPTCQCDVNRITDGYSIWDAEGLLNTYLFTHKVPTPVQSIVDSCWDANHKK